MATEITTTRNALAFPQVDYVGPTVDDDIRRIIGRYGESAVKDAVKRLTARRKGRPLLKDWNELKPHIQACADRWIAGEEDPFNTPTNYAIAKEIADKGEPHNHPATMQRIQRKLREERGRKWFTLVDAYQRGGDNLTFKTYMRTIDELCRIDPKGHWNWLAERAVGLLTDYLGKHDELPDDITFAEVEAGARKTMNAPTSYANSRRSGLFGTPYIRAKGAPDIDSTIAALVSRYSVTDGTGI